MTSITNESFTMMSHPCECFVDTTHDESGNEMHRLRVQEKKDIFLKFAYMPKEGLVMVDNTTGSVLSKNILGELIAIKAGEREKLIRFFSEYGFFTPLSGSVLESFDFGDIFTVHKRIKETLHLMSLMQEPYVQYKTMLSIISWLIFSERVSLTSEEQEKSLLETCVHSYIAEQGIQIRMDYSYDGYDPYSSQDITVKDTIYGGEQIVSLSQFENESFTADAQTRTNTILNRYEAAKLYLFHQECDPSVRKVIDYFYHVTQDIGELLSFDTHGRAVFDCPDGEFTNRFNDKLRAATIEVAKIIIKEELDYAINAIYPAYDIETMSAAWKIPDLYSALFFSIFYMKPEVEIYRKCENPNCECYFLVSTTNSKRKYCSEECSNAMQQRKYRKRKKKAPTEADAF